MIAVIGIDRYQHWEGLSNAVQDATGAASLFRRLGFEQIAALVDEEATGRAIQSLVTNDLAELGPDDSLVLFYAGHGGTRTHEVGNQVVKTGYLIPVDASRSEAETDTWVNLDAWLDAISVLPARHILVVLDACNSGIALKPLHKWREIGVTPGQSIAALDARCSRRVITSALDDQVALDTGPLPGHSLFTGCLIEALTHGIRRGPDAVITGSEIALYVQQRVTTYPGSQQTPDFGAFGLDDRGELTVPALGAGDAALALASGRRRAVAARRNTRPRRLPVGTSRWSALLPVPRPEPTSNVALDLYRRGIHKLRILCRATFERLRVGFADGHGEFLLAMLCFGAAAYLFHLALKPERLGQEYLERAIIAEQEPLRGEYHPVLSGLLLPRQAPDNLLCENGAPTTFLGELDRDAGTFTQAYFASDTTPQTPYGYNFLPLLAQRETGGVGQAWTDNHQGSTLVVPSLVAAVARNAVIQQAEGAGRCAATRDLGCPIYALYQDPILRSRAIENLAARPAGGPDAYGLTGWYFISVEGIERSAPRWTNPRTLTADRLYHGASYFYWALSGTTPQWGTPLSCRSDRFRVVTNPYFDMTGGGVVRTICYRISHPRAEQTAGVLCADLSLPERQIVAQLQQASAALDLSLVRVRGKQATPCARWSAPCALDLSRIPADEAEHYALKVISDNEETENSILGVESVHLYQDYFGITVRVDGDDQIVAVGRVARSRARDKVSLLGSAVCLLIGVIVLVMSYRRQLRRREAWLARGLPHGVVQLDDKGRVLGCNDRAQQIFERMLPRLGIDAITHDDPHAIWLPGLFADERCLVITDEDGGGHADLRDPDGGLAPCTHDEVLRRLSRGHALSFYARTPVRWLRIDASPFVSPDLRVGILAIVSTRLEGTHRPHLNAFQLGRAPGAGET